MRSIKWCHFQWPGTNRNPVFKVTPLFDAKYTSILYRFWVIWRWVIKSGSFKMVPFESLGAVSSFVSYYSPSVVTMVLSRISSETNLDICRKSWFFHTPLHSAPPLGGSPLEYCQPIWCGKTRVVGLPDGENFLRICVTVYTQYRRVMDGQTDRRTDI